LEVQRGIALLALYWIRHYSIMRTTTYGIQDKIRSLHGSGPQKVKPPRTTDIVIGSIVRMLTEAINGSQAV